MSQKVEIRNLKDIRKQRLKITEKRKSMESQMFSFSSNDSSESIGNNLLFSTARNFIFNRFFNRKKRGYEVSDPKTSIAANITGKVDKWGIASFISQLLTHRASKTSFSLTKRSFIKWQLFNISIFLIRWGYKTYQRKKLEKKYDDAIIVEE